MANRNETLGGTDWASSNILYAADLNDTFDASAQWISNSLEQAGINYISQLEAGSVLHSTANIGGWGDSYIDATGRNESVVVGSTTATFSSAKYAAIDAGSSVYVDIEATSLDTADFAINDCTAQFVDTGKWRLTCSVGTDEVQRAKIYYTLFKGVDNYGSFPRASSSYITGLTALKTSVTRDVGKRAFSVAFSHSGGNTTYTGTFADTTTNTSCSSWSEVRSQNGTTAQWEMPSGTILNSTTGGPSIVIDEFKLDKSADEKSNPATCQSDLASDFASTHVYSLVLCHGDCSFSKSGSGTANLDDFNANGIPNLTAVSGASATPKLIVQDIPSGTYGSTISEGFGVPKVADWEDGDDVQFKFINASEDSGWFTCGSSRKIHQFTAFTSEPTQLLVQLVPTTGSATVGYPAIYGFYAMGK